MRSCLQDLELQSYLLYAQLILMTVLPQATKKLNYAWCIFVYIFYMITEMMTSLFECIIVSANSS